LLKLGGKDLLQRKILRLMHPRTGHTWSLLSGERQASRLRAAVSARLAPNETQHVCEASGTPLASCETQLLVDQMKRIVFVLSALTVASISIGTGQTPDANQEQRLLALIKEVQTQQAQMAENEKNIEQKLAELTEEIRTARIYTKRER
jgi:hypothetical protein